MGGAAALALLLAAGPYGVSIFMPDSGSFGISDLELKKIQMKFPSESLVQLVSRWSSPQMVLRCGLNPRNSPLNLRFTVPISEIFVGNAWQCNSGSCPTTPVIEYVISVSSGDTTQTIDINPEFMTREVLDSGVKISPVTKTDNSGEETITEIDGIRVEMMAGLLPTSHEHLNGGGHTDANGIWIEGDYTLEMVVKRGQCGLWPEQFAGLPNLSEWFPYIEVAGTTATSCRGTPA